MIDDEIEIAEPFNNYLINIATKLRICAKEQSAVSTENSLSEVERAIAKYRNYPSINSVTEKMQKTC